MDDPAIDCHRIERGGEPLASLVDDATVVHTDCGDLLGDATGYRAIVRAGRATGPCRSTASGAAFAAARDLGRC